MRNSLRTEQWATWICLGAGGILCIGLLVEFALGLAPCPLCMMQRIWFALTASSLGLVCIITSMGHLPVSQRAVRLVGGGFAIRQLWLQSLPSDHSLSCADLSYMIDAFPLGDLLAAMTSGTGDCAVVHDVIPLMSIAGWALIGFSLLFFASVMQLRQSLR